MATRAMAVAMMVATGGCAALGAHGRSATGQVPGGDEVYVVLMPRKGGGALIGLYPKVPWSSGSAPVQSARR